MDPMLTKRSLRNRLNLAPRSQPATTPPRARPVAPPPPPPPAKPAPVKLPKAAPAPVQAERKPRRRPKAVKPPRVIRPRIYWEFDAESTRHHALFGGTSRAWALMLRDGDRVRKFTVIYSRAMPSPEDAANLWRTIRRLVRNVPHDPVVVGLKVDRPETSA